MNRRTVGLVAAIGAIATLIVVLALPSASSIGHGASKAIGAWNSVSAPSSDDPTSDKVTATSTVGDGNATPPASADPTTSAPTPESTSAPAPSSSDTTTAPPTDPSTTHTTTHPSCGSACSTTTQTTSPSGSSVVSIDSTAQNVSVETGQTVRFCAVVTCSRAHRNTLLPRERRELVRSASVLCGARCSATAVQHFRGATKSGQG